jgi:ABC-type nitrate/sulfonate/bicarbonate transport system permease component
MLKIIKPFEELTSTLKTLIVCGWLLILLTVWFISASTSTTHLFPTPSQVASGFADLYRDGLVIHIVSSIWLCTKSVFIAILISLIFCYASPMPILKPIATFISKFRYLPLTGISFYISIMINDARSIQVWVLVVFMTTFLITSLLQMIKDIPNEEFDHARSLGCNRWEILWEVVIKGRIDYVLELVRQNLAIVWMMLVTVESILVAAGGLGFLIKNNDKLGDSGKVIALQIIIVIVGLTLDFTITKIRKLIFRYSNF